MRSSSETSERHLDQAPADGYGGCWTTPRGISPILSSFRYINTDNTHRHVCLCASLPPGINRAHADCQIVTPSDLAPPACSIILSPTKNYTALAPDNAVPYHFRRLAVCRHTRPGTDTNQDSSRTWSCPTTTPPEVSYENRCECALSVPGDLSTREPTRRMTNHNWGTLKATGIQQSKSGDLQLNGMSPYVSYADNGFSDPLDGTVNDVQLVCRYGLAGSTTVGDV